MRAAIVAPVLGGAAIAGIVTGLLLGGPHQETARPAPAVIQPQPAANVQQGTFSMMGPTQCHR